MVARRNLELRLPEALAMLGICRGIVVEDEESGQWAAFGQGLVLASSPDGRQLFALNMRGRAILAGASRSQQARAAVRLREEFSDRRADGLAQVLIPPPSVVQYLGQAAIIRYVLARGGDETQEWEHYFAGDDKPEYPGVYSVGNQQLWIPPAAFMSTAGGITYRRP